MALVIRQSQIHADGVYTTTPIKKRTIVVEYTGPRLTNAEADDIYEYSPRTYLFGLVDGEHVIDGDGIAAFINHCCDPNCEADEVKQRVIIRAVRDIEAGEELAYDYNLYDGDPEDSAPCWCGAKKCRGSMYSRKELAKRKKNRAALDGQQRAAVLPRSNSARPNSTLVNLGDTLVGHSGGRA